MTEQQAAAFEQLVTIELVGYRVGREPRTLLVRVDGKLFKLSPAGYLQRVTS